MTKYDISNNSGQHAGIALLRKNATQLHPVENKNLINKHHDVVIGLDCGTSCTKAVIHLPYLAGKRALLVPFEEDGHESNRHFLPSHLYIDISGKCSLSHCKNSIVFTKLKSALLSDERDEIFKKNDTTLNYRAIVISYLAIVLQEVRNWFLKNHYQLISDGKIRWHLNLGIPTAGYKDEDQKQLFKEVATTAWQVSTLFENININKVMKLINSLKGEFVLHDIHPDDINVIPEVAAQVVGYARSSLRETGLHVLIDIGSRTVDIASFILYQKEGEDQYSILTAALEDLGVLMLDLNRLKGLSTLLSNELQKQWRERNSDPIKPIPEEISHYIPKINSDDEFYIDGEFYKSCQKLFSKTISDLKKNRDPHSDRWRNGLPIFICGGGKEIKIYEKALREAESILIRSFYMKGLDLRDLPKPENLTGDYLTKQNYHRFSVAYGLSFPPDDIGQINQPGEIGDILKASEPACSINYPLKEYT